MAEVVVVQDKQARSGKSSAKANGRGLGCEHPLNDVIGSMEGDEWEKVLRNIERNRKEVDRLYNKQHVDEE